MSSGGELGFCPVCFRDLHGAWTCKRRTCGSYAPKYLRDQAERIKAALAEWDGETTIATLTAPGADVLPWDARLCSIDGPHEHSGPNGCRVDEWAAARWNLTATKRLSELVKRADARCRNRKLARPVLLLIVLEVKRGVFHAHLIYGYKGYSRAGLELVLDTLDELRGEYEFGTSKRGGFDRGKPGRFNGPHAGMYASKYLRPDGAKGSFVPALMKIDQLIPRDPMTGRPTLQVRPVYVNPKLTLKSGVTMRFLRWGRYAYMKWGRVELPRDELLAVYRLVRVFNAELEEFAPERPQPPPPPPEDDWPF